MPAKRLTPKLARDLAAADAQLAQARALVAIRERDVRQLRDQARPFLPDGEPVMVAGVTLKRSESQSESFSLKRYREAGGKLTAAMRKAISVATRETWTVHGG